MGENRKKCLKKKSYKATINPQMSGPRHYRWRRTTDHLRPRDEARMRLLEFRTFKTSKMDRRILKPSVCPGKKHAQKKPEKTLSFNLRVIL